MKHAAATQTLDKYITKKNVSGVKQFGLGLVMKKIKYK